MDIKAYSETPKNINALIENNMGLVRKIAWHMHGRVKSAVEIEDLIQIAVSKGKKQNKKIKLGICGEHGGDPKSILFCSKIGLNYVSCSPYRVPIARLAAAQAELKKRYLKIIK
mgnify:CR=1 FL=1